MSSKSKRLGTLADVFQAEKLDGTIRHIRLEKISPSENQPRQDRKKGVEELAESLKNEGLLQPIIVTKSEHDDSYKIIAGERRYHAARSLDWQEIECKILSKNEKETFRLAIIENLQRENLSPYEEIDALIQLKNDFNYTDSDLGELLGKSRSYTTEMLSITALSKEQIGKCKEMNIDNKNLLVQAAQAAKNSLFEDFLTQIAAGNVKTVKEAKEFNRSAKNPPKKTAPQQLFETEPSWKIVKKENQITITCDSSKTASDIFRLIKKELQKNN